MGRRPKPTAKRKLEGSALPYSDREPVLPPADPTPPEELAADAVAIAEWNRLLPLLQQAHVVSAGDRGSLLALCQQWSRYLAANAAIGGSGMVVRSPSGYPMPNPYIAIANRSLAMCVKLWIELGLTPSARTRIATDAGGLGPLPNDAFAEFDDPPTRTPH